MDWPAAPLAAMRERYGPLLAVHRLAREAAPGALTDPSGKALARLCAGQPMQYLVRPDGHMEHHLGRWLPASR